jgi:hypothetical protein
LDRVKYIDQHPEKRHLSFKYLTPAALEGVWRCKDQEWTVIEERPMKENGCRREVGRN